MSQNADRSPSLLKRLVIWSVPFVLLTLITAFAVWSWRANSAFQLQVQRIRDRGEPLRLEEVLPEIAAEEDAGPLLREALSRYQAPDEEYFVLLNAQPPTPPGDYRAFRAALETNAPTLKLVDQAIGRPHCRLMTDGENSFQQIRRLSELLRAQALQLMGTGRHEQALQSVVQCLQLSRLIRSEPFSSSRFAGHAVAIDATQALQEMLGHSNLADQGFEQTDSLLAEIEQQSSIKPTVIAERAIGVERFETLFNHGSWWEQPLFSYAKYKETETRFLRSMTDMAEIIDGEGPDVDLAVTALDEKIPMSLSMSSTVYFPVFSGLRREVLRDRQRMILARFALRVDRYRQEQGEFPRTLAQVCDRQLNQVPPDLVHGKPLVYETHEHGFVIRTQVEQPAGEGFASDCRFEVIYPAGGDLQDAGDDSTQE